MLIDICNLKTKYDLHINGVIHVGAHFGNENQVYEKLNIKNKIFFESSYKTFIVLTQNLSHTEALLINKAVGNENKSIMLNIETHNEGQSNSILQPKLHLQQYPNIKFHNQEMVDMIRLDDFLQEKQKYNFLNIDVQGYELEVLKGCEKLLNNIDYIMTEINKAELYENCAQVEQIIEFLKSYNFVLVEQNWLGGTWGDGFFIKK